MDNEIPLPETDENEDDPIIAEVRIVTYFLG